MSARRPRAELGERVRGVYVLVDDDPRWRHDVETQLEAAVAGGVRLVQLRLKHTPDADALRLVRAAVDRARGSETRVIVNDRFDLALAGGADGVHLGQDDLPPAALPDTARAQLLIGRSTHTPEQLRISRDEPIDYVAFGPTFATDSKRSGYTERGLDALGEAVRIAAHPLVAIGGITRERIADVAARGVAAAAVISAVADADDPRAALAELELRFAAGRKRAPRDGAEGARAEA